MRMVGSEWYAHCNDCLRCPFGKGDSRVVSRAPSRLARSRLDFNPSSTHAKHHGGLAPRDSTGNQLDDLMTADSPGSLQPLPRSGRAERHFPASGFPNMPPNRIHAGRILLGRAHPSGTGSPQKKPRHHPAPSVRVRSGAHVGLAAGDAVRPATPGSESWPPPGPQRRVRAD